MDADKLVEYNPVLASINPTARIAYAKFKLRLIRKEFEDMKSMSRAGSISMRRGSSTMRKSISSASQQGSIDGGNNGGESGYTERRDSKGI